MRLCFEDFDHFQKYLRPEIARTSKTIIFTSFIFIKSCAPMLPGHATLPHYVGNDFMLLWTPAHGILWETQYTFHYATSILVFSVHCYFANDFLSRAWFPHYCTLDRWTGYLLPIGNHQNSGHPHLTSLLKVHSPPPFFLFFFSS